MDPNKTAVVLVEFQNDFTSEGGALHGAVKESMDSTGMIANTRAAVAAARAAGATIITKGMIMSPRSFMDRPYCIRVPGGGGGAENLPPAAIFASAGACAAAFFPVIPLDSASRSRSASAHGPLPVAARSAAKARSARWPGSACTSRWFASSCRCRRPAAKSPPRISAA